MSVNNGWMRTEYDFNTPAVCMLIDAKEWLDHLDSNQIFPNDDPEEIAKQGRSFIENKFPFLSGCIIFYVRYDIWRRMLEIGVAHERFKRVPMGQMFPKVRVLSSENLGLQLGPDECRIEDVLRVGAVTEWEKEQHPLMTFEVSSDAVVDTVDREKLKQEIVNYWNGCSPKQIITIPDYNLKTYVDSAPNQCVKINSPITDNGMKVASNYTPGSIGILPDSVQHRNDNETDSGADKPTIVSNTE